MADWKCKGKEEWLDRRKDLIKRIRQRGDIVLGMAGRLHEREVSKKCKENSGE